MREFFTQFGKVIDSTVMLDRETGRSKGFGFVSFEDTNVQPFLGFGNLEIDGKLVCHVIESCKLRRCILIIYIFPSLGRLMLSSLNLGISETIFLMKRQQQQQQLVEVLISLKLLVLVVLAAL
jgi:RNA recognition motif. (a.k.a. RRM, RBD, or RNP domain)